MRKGSRRLSSLALLVLSLLLLAACSQAPVNPETQIPPIEDDQEIPLSAWTSADIGDLNHEGETTLDPQGSIIVTAGGTDVWGNSDSFHFLYQKLEGDVTLTARVSEVVAAHEWTKAGLMVREGLNADARNAFLLLTDSNGALFQRRQDPGGVTQDTLPDGYYARDYDAIAPWWLRIVRSGDTITAFNSPDGEQWSQLGRYDVQLPEEVYVGMALTSRNGQETARAVFSQIALKHDALDGEEPVPAPVPQPVPSPTPSPAPNPGDRTSTSYQVDDSTNFANPERGLHGNVNMLTGDGFSNVVRDGYTLARSLVRLDSYRHQALPSSVLTQLRSSFQKARDNGIKLIIRFNYNHGFDADAPYDMVLTHISQLKPILEEYQDVIATMQAGFIGAWGEWHNSTNGLLDQSRKAGITDALLDALPDSRMLQIRTPGHIRSLIGSPSSGTQWFGTSSEARIGFVNDCFVANGSDAGTYGGDQDRNEAAQRSVYTVTGGETCDVSYPNSYSSCERAMDELGRFSWDYLNAGFHVGVLDRWRNEGCFNEVARRLGYRFAMTNGAVTSSVTPGEAITVALTIRNNGFGKLYNPRPAEILLRNRATGRVVELRAQDDVRSLMPLAGETRNVELTAQVPGGLAQGTYDVLIRLPDASDRLADDHRYSVRFANNGTWQQDLGANDLQLTTNVSN